MVTSDELSINDDDARPPIPEGGLPPPPYADGILAVAATKGI